MNQMTNQAPNPKRSRLKKALMYAGGALAAVLIVIQFVPVAAMENPAVVADFEESAEVEAVLRRACYDCHSNEVKWPWYSRIAPASWLVASDVVEGRKAFNLSDWPEDEDDRQFARESALEQVVDGEMPPWFYTPMHPEAKLTPKDLEILKKWGAEKEEEEEEEDEEEQPAPSAAGSGSAAPAGSAAEEEEEEEE
jgi:hypothetical protein